MIAKCKGCGKEERVYARGLCMRCYYNWRYNETASVTKERRRKSFSKWVEKIGGWEAYKRWLRDYYRRNKERFREYQREYYRRKKQQKH